MNKNDLRERNKCVVVNNGWEINGYNVSLLCPKCKTEIDRFNYGGYEFEASKFKYRKNYCPYCGWRIEG